MPSDRKKTRRSVEFFVCRQCDSVFKGQVVLTIETLQNGHQRFSRTHYRCPRCHGTNIAIVGGRSYSDRMANLGFKSDLDFRKHFVEKAPKSYVEEWFE